MYSCSGCILAGWHLQMYGICIFYSSKILWIRSGWKEKYIFCIILNLKGNIYSILFSVLFFVVAIVLFSKHIVCSCVYCIVLYVHRVKAQSLTPLKIHFPLIWNIHKKQLICWRYKCNFFAIIVYSKLMIYSCSLSMFICTRLHQTQPFRL